MLLLIPSQVNKGKTSLMQFVMIKKSYHICSNSWPKITQFSPLCFHKHPGLLTVEPQKHALEHHAVGSRQNITRTRKFDMNLTLN
jgi:hypothetical protein